MLLKEETAVKRIQFKFFLLVFVKRLIGGIHIHNETVLIKQLLRELNRLSRNRCIGILIQQIFLLLRRISAQYLRLHSAHMIIICYSRQCLPKFVHAVFTLGQVTQELMV